MPALQTNRRGVLSDVVTVHAGGIVTGLTHSANGILDFSYAAGDATVISGTNRFGDFSVADNLVQNIDVANNAKINLSGNITVENLHLGGALTAEDGVVFTGNFDIYGNADTVFEWKSGVKVEDLHLYTSTSSHRDYYINSGVTINNSILDFGTHSRLEISSGAH